MQRKSRLIFGVLAGAGVAASSPLSRADVPAWSGYANGPQHAALAPTASDPLQTIRWSTPVDLAPPFSGGELFIHYGSPSITAANTLLLPVKLDSAGNFEINAINASTGASKWVLPTDYTLPSSGWVPSYSPTLTPQNRLYYPGGSGTVYSITNPDSPTTPIPTQTKFYTGALDPNIKICTPITSDASGDIYFGFRSTTTTTLGFASGIARIDPSGVATYTSAATLSGDPSINTIAMNCAPALSPDGTKLYIGINNGSTGKLVEANSATLAPLNAVSLVDPKTNNAALITDLSTASPTIGPDGDVYYGVLDNAVGSNNDRGWLMHFKSNLAPAAAPASAAPGAFGWDDTASIVPASMVPSYTGTSSYLLMTKYNNYAGIGTGNGVNKIAILDPNATETDPVSGLTTMNEVLSIAGVTPDPTLPQVREWCINNAVVDPATDSILANSEDGKLYRWNLATDSFTQVITLTGGLGEAYTPTLVGPDGAVYAINDAQLFSVVPEPASALMILSAMPLLFRRRSKA